MCFEYSIPVEYQEGASKAAAAILGMNNILLAAHINPDGDALGSLAACGEILQRLGKNFYLYCPSGVPRYLDFLPLPGKVYHSLSELPSAPDFAIYLDCSEPRRLGAELALHYKDWPSVNIDHHISPVELGSLANFIRPEASATVQLVAYTSLALNIELSGRLANAIGLGLITDTGGFCHDNTTALVFNLAGLLANLGCEFSWLRQNLQHTWTIGNAHLWGSLLKELKLEAEGRIALAEVTAKTLKHFHCEAEDLEGLVDLFGRIKSVKTACLIREDGPDCCKFSLRSHGTIDVRKMAVEAGGGGHENAAGGTLRLPIEEAGQLLTEIIRKHLDS